jgi:hypothetical protein
MEQKPKKPRLERAGMPGSRRLTELITVLSELASLALLTLTKADCALFCTIAAIQDGWVTSGHQRESFCVKPLAGAQSVVCPCIAVTGFDPAARDRADETTDGAAHDERRDHRGVSMPRRARPGRQLGGPAAVSGGQRRLTGPAAVRGDERIPGLPAGDDGMQVPLDYRGDDGLGLGGGQLVLRAAGQVVVAGTVDRISPLGAPDRSTLSAGCRVPTSTSLFPTCTSPCSPTWTETTDAIAAKAQGWGVTARATTSPRRGSRGKA